jgi:hypothetical protein
MKTPASPYVVAILILGSMAPLSAQNLASTQTLAALKADGIHGSPSGFAGNAVAPGSYEVPALEKAQSGEAEDRPVFNAQDAATLEEKTTSAREVDSVVNLDLLRNPSPYRKVLVNGTISADQVSTGSLQEGLAEISAVYRESGKKEQSSDCLAISLSVEQRVKLDVSKVLEIVDSEVTANPGCSCEIVKTAIKASDADVQGVVAIVETAIHASPESMRIISQCAIAANPEAITAVQALLTKLDPNAGETGYSSKSSKSAKDGNFSKVASIEAPALPNPLDLPPSGPPITPPPITPPLVTEVNPGTR